MTIEEIRNYCLLKKGVTAGFPLDADTIAFKVSGSYFFLLSVEDMHKVSFICSEEDSQMFCKNYDFIKKTQHFKSDDWVYFQVNDITNDVFIQSIIDKAYEFVLTKLTDTKRNTINNL